MGYEYELLGVFEHRLTDDLNRRAAAGWRVSTAHRALPDENSKIWWTVLLERAALKDETRHG